MAAFHGGQCPPLSRGPGAQAAPVTDRHHTSCQGCGPCSAPGVSSRLPAPHGTPSLAVRRGQAATCPTCQGTGGAERFLRERRGPPALGFLSLQWGMWCPVCGCRRKHYMASARGPQGPRRPQVGRRAVVPSGPTRRWAGPGCFLVAFSGGFAVVPVHVWASGFGVRGCLCSWGCPQLCQVPRQPGGVSACLVRQEPASLPVNTGRPRVHALCRLLGVWGSPRGDTDPGGLRPSSLTVAISLPGTGTWSPVPCWLPCDL